VITRATLRGNIVSYFGPRELAIASPHFLDPDFEVRVQEAVVSKWAGFSLSVANGVREPLFNIHDMPTDCRYLPTIRCQAAGANRLRSWGSR
jgi:hypothetical protein